ncbi:MAG: hypothetical protein IPN33_22420 [Saprospiraceae bacterium]|nr:hypothetical protein [Saprospiraceae bacterium]
MSIAADTSSQFISALLMIAPTLPQGLELTLEGNLVSRPYILMTLRLEYFGAQHTWKDRVIRVAPQSYVPQGRLPSRPCLVGASYYYAIAALLRMVATCTSKACLPIGMQGDSVIKDIMLDLGVALTFTGTAFN